MEYKVMYNPRLDLSGLLLNDGYIKVVIHEGMRTFMMLTEEWIEVEVL